MSYGQPPNGPQGYGQQPGGPQYQPPQPMSPEDQRLWATLTHVGINFFGFVAPLVAYFVLRDRGQFVREHSRVALNFSITMAIADAVGVITSWLGIGLLIILAVRVVTIVFTVMAALSANRGQFHRYPLSIEFVKN
ncbi:DUF4870 domain-containing protein [Curtobacterium sp. MCBA15_001]|uniref:DUF4870 domain-containing protein n=1 Tax=Curtobacterium sp. MCBA15_001 TaxID=1898731 RepID=UPI0008DDF3E3|nr:DUF4870 domain-containing protein [Curtobacterium sp. MCBA15_001]OIH96282.1 hypothetical protein BIU90_00600 [Curtobacterium sp. MCBA15_001]